jgi:hypothetical protein
MLLLITLRTCVRDALPLIARANAEHWPYHRGRLFIARAVHMGCVRREGKAVADFARLDGNFRRQIALIAF